uniref:MBD domain-containing protein n=1 Tax=Strigamia maritima TaxID=126957 RepID=T1IJP1_STRMM
MLDDSLEDTDRIMTVEVSVEQQELRWKNQKAKSWFANVVSDSCVQENPSVCSVSLPDQQCEWYLDSCASHHVCGERDMFYSFQAVQPMKLELGEGVSHLKIIGSLAYVNIPKQKQTSKLNARAWKDVIVGYSMQTKGYRIWDPLSDDVYESIHVKVDETRLYKDVNQDFQNEGPFQKPDSKDSFALHEDSDDSSIEDNALQQPLVPDIPSASMPVTKPPLPAASTAPPRTSRPNRIAFKDKVLNRPGWEREEVQRQSGTTAGKWDVYFYGPGRVRLLRSRPEVEDYCKTLKVKYDPRDFKWDPTSQSIDTFDLDRTEVSTIDKNDESYVPSSNSDTNGESEACCIRVYCASVKEPSTFEDAVISPEKREMG